MRTNLSAPERFVIICLLAFGILAALATPISAGYDEETHFIRAWEMAHLYFVPNEQLGAQLPFPAIYWDLSYRRQPIVEAVEPGFWNKFGHLRMDARDYIYANVETRSVYSPLLLLPQAIALRYLGLSLQFPALAVYYGCRLVGLLSYLLLVWLAVRLVPFGKWLLAVLAASPMAVFQASTISADTISNGIAFVFVAASLAIARRESIGWKTWSLQLGLLAMLLFGKVNLIYLAFLPFLLIQPSRFRMRFGLAFLAVATVALFLIEVVGWNVLAYSKFTRALEGANPGQQLQFILGDPLLFVKIIAQDIWQNTPAYLRGWIGVYGYNYWPVPGLTYLLFPLAVLASLWATEGEESLGPRTRWILAGLFVVGSLLTIVSLYVAFTPARSLYVAGVQGRYFTVVMPLVWLALWGLGRSKMTRLASIGMQKNPLNYRAVSGCLAVGALALYSAGLVLSYHVPCGSEFYRWSLCYQPQYKNWAPETVSSPSVTSTVRLQQEIIPRCDGMTSLRLWINSNGTGQGGHTILGLRAPTQEKDVARHEFANAQLPDKGWLEVDIAPEWNSADQLYLLQLTGTASDGIRIGYSERAEYLSGRLMENEIPLGQDVLFQYGCIAGLQRLSGVGR